MNRKLLILTQFIFWGILYTQNYSVENAFPNLSFTDPVGIYHADDGTNRLFVLEQPGTIKVFNNDPSTTTVQTFLNTNTWLTLFIESKLFLSIMHKYPGYQSGQKSLIVNFSTM